MFDQLSFEYDTNILLYSPTENFQVEFILIQIVVI